MYCDWLLAGVGRFECHQPDPWLLHRSRRLSRLGIVSIPFGLALVRAGDSGTLVLHPRLPAAAIAAQSRHHRAGAGDAHAHIRARPDPEQCDDLLLQGGLSKADVEPADGFDLAV